MTAPTAKVHTDGRVVAAAVFWRGQGRPRATVVVKASYAFAADADATLVAPLPIELRDRQFGNHPARSVEAASEVAPRLARCDVTFVGSAHAPAGQPATRAAVRLAVFRDGTPALDKTLHVYGDRDGATLKPFTKMSLVYERAAGGVGVATNPFGVDAPNVVDPADASRPSGFGPIARTTPTRKRLLAGASHDALVAPLADISEGFAWAYFQSAPEDQQVAPLQGGEWIVLDGLSATAPRVSTRVPALAAQAVVDGAPVSLAADMLVIDGARAGFSIVWRGERELSAAEVRDGITVGAALGSAVDWAALLGGVAAGAAPTAAPELDPEGTAMASPDAVARPLAPFAIAAAGTGAPSSSATPWGAAPEPPPSLRSPSAADADPEGTMMVGSAPARAALPFEPGAAPTLSREPSPPVAREVGDETVTGVGAAADAAPGWLGGARDAPTFGGTPSPWAAPAGSVAPAPTTIGQRIAGAAEARPVALNPLPVVASEKPVKAPPRAAREDVERVLQQAGATPEDIARLLALVAARGSATERGGGGDEG